MKRLGLSVLLVVLPLSAWSAESLRLLTENYPPFNMEGPKGKTIGMSTEIVELMMSRSNTAYTIELQPWIRAFNTALRENNTCVYSTTRTEPREAQFKWVGPLVENPWVIYVRPGGPKDINSLEDARPYKIGGYTGDATAQYLIARGFEVELVPADFLNARKLAAGRIDLWATGKYLGAYLVKQENQPQLKPVFTFNTTFMYLACNLQVPDTTIRHLNDTLQQMQHDGSLAKIRQRYSS